MIGTKLKVVQKQDDTSRKCMVCLEFQYFKQNIDFISLKGIKKLFVMLTKRLRFSVLYSKHDFITIKYIRMIPLVSLTGLFLKGSIFHKYLLDHLNQLLTTPQQ